jgi:hypothetical protein
VLRLLSTFELDAVIICDDGDTLVILWRQVLRDRRKCAIVRCVEQSLFRDRYAAKQEIFRDVCPTSMLTRNIAHHYP